MMTRRLFVLAYFAAALSASLSAAYGPQLAARALKGVPLLLLLFELGPSAMRHPRRRFALFVWLGLVASLVGDVAIDVSFLGGIVGFFVAHLLYLAAMGFFPRTRALAQAMAALPALALWLGFLLLLIIQARAPAELRGPVAAYITVISWMLARAMGRGVVEPRARQDRLMLAGAGLFVVSDSLIALGRWVVEIPYPRLSILVTYFAGQWLISRAALSNIAPDQER